MRRVLVFGLSLLACLCVLGCGGAGTQESTTEAAVLPTQAATVTATLTVTPPPTSTEVATDTPTPTRTFTPTPRAASTATPTATYTATPTETPAATPTATTTSTPTRKPTARPTKTATPTPAAYPPPVLLAPPDDHMCFQPPPHDGVTCGFRWSWEGALGPDEYFQVQFIGANNEHRGVHAPTKELSYTYIYSHWGGWSADWCDFAQPCRLQWTVVVVEWDGVDPGRLGRTLAEAAPRFFYL